MKENHNSLLLEKYKELFEEYKNAGESLSILEKNNNEEK